MPSSLPGRSCDRACCAVLGGGGHDRTHHSGLRGRATTATAGINRNITGLALGSMQHAEWGTGHAAFVMPAEDMYSDAMRCDALLVHVLEEKALPCYGVE